MASLSEEEFISAQNSQLKEQIKDLEEDFYLTVEALNKRHDKMRADKGQLKEKLMAAMEEIKMYQEQIGKLIGENKMLKRENEKLNKKKQFGLMQAAQKEQGFRGGRKGLESVLGVKRKVEEETMLEKNEKMNASARRLKLCIE